MKIRSRVMSVLLASCITLVEGAAGREPDWTSKVSFDGYATVHIGMDEAQMRRATGFTGKPDTAASGSDDCSYVQPPGWPKGVTIMMLHGRIARIDIFQPGTMTDARLEVGDAEGEVYARYSKDGFVWSTHHFYTDGKYLMVLNTAADRALLFETDNRVITMYRIGTIQAVQLVEGCA